jgi:DNA-binding response OmpR family regulator
MAEKKTIIIIDDDVDILEAVRLTLEAAGYGVLTAGDGTEGLARVREGGVDLIILDVMLARDTEGFQVAQDLKASPELAAIPILMMTSVSAKSGFKFDPKADGDFLPVEDYVEKPVDPAELVSRVKKLLGQA